MLHGLDSSGPDQARLLSNEFETKAFFSGADLRNPLEIETMIREAMEQLDGLDVLINNAGIQHVAPIESFPIQQWNEILAINLTSAFLTSRAIWPHMKEKGYGRIINMASVHGKVASEFKSAYVAAKHGLLGLTKVLALEGAPFNITCNAICPGYVKTPLVSRQIVEQAKAHGIPEEKVVSQILLAKQPIKRFIDPSAIAELALFLASETSDTVTGEAFSLDGGWGAQ